MIKLLNAYRSMRYDGLGNFLIKLFGKLRRDKFAIFGYKQYQLEFSPVKKTEVMEFLNGLRLSINDLVVVPDLYKEFIKGRFDGYVISTMDLPLPVDPVSFDRLIWASERVDVAARIARSFYFAGKPVVVLKKTGPARVWMHDQFKEQILREEFSQQTKEGIEKFGHGIGADFGNLMQVIDNCTNVEGDFVEIGCFMGSSTCVLARYIDLLRINKKLFVYDFFDGFTYEQAGNSIDSTWVGTHTTDGEQAVRQRVEKRFKHHGDQLQIIRRNVIEQNAIHEVEKIAFANIDVDIYEAVYASLWQVHAKLSKNGIMVVEDAGHTPWLLGAKVALEEFLADVGSEAYTKIQMESGQYLLIRR